MTEEHEVPKENGFDGIVRPLTASDIPQLKPILETWIRYPVITGELLEDEVAEVIDEMNKSLSGENKKKYLTATSKEGKVLGVMGYQDLREEMTEFAQTDKPAEIINANVAPDQRQQGVGRAIVAGIETEVQQKGFKELLLNSGPRYKETGWPFWKKLFGESVGELKDFYGAGFSAQVWRKVF